MVWKCDRQASRIAKPPHDLIVIGQDAVDLCRRQNMAPSPGRPLPEKGRGRAGLPFPETIGLFLCPQSVEPCGCNGRGDGAPIMGKAQMVGHLVQRTFRVGQ